MVKYFKYGAGNWVGYDDEETYALEEAYASSNCLGGLMIWSVDFDAETGGGNYSVPGNVSLVWVDPKIWDEANPQIQCYFPCTLMIPP
jgi:GH18 family chitinase